MYPHQAERLTVALDRDSLDALVATSPASVAYVTGLHERGPGSFPYPNLAVFTRDGTALIAAADAALAIAWDGVDADHVFVFGDPAGLASDSAAGPEAKRLREIVALSSADRAGALAAALDRLGVRRGSVGLDESWLTHEGFRSLEERLTDQRVVAAATWLAEARRVKGPYEIECLGRALQIAEEALDAVIQTLDRGATEQEVAVSFGSEVLKRGGWPFPPLIGMGSRTALPSPQPTEALLRPGALVRFDVGCTVNGYCASVARTAVLGEPPTRIEAAYRAVQAGLEEAIGALGASASAKGVLGAAVEAARAAGLSGYRLDRLGRGIGLDREEAPSLDAGGGVLEAGEVLCVETPCYEFGDFGVSARDTVLVAMGGGRALNRSHHGLVILD